MKNGEKHFVNPPLIKIESQSFHNQVECQLYKTRSFLKRIMVCKSKPKF